MAGRFPAMTIKRTVEQIPLMDQPKSFTGKVEPLANYLPPRLLLMMLMAT